MSQNRDLFEWFESRRQTVSGEPAPQPDKQTGIVMRPYQEEAVQAVFREWERGNRSTLVVIPTGGGKSVVFSEVIRRHLSRQEKCCD